MKKKVLKFCLIAVLLATFLFKPLINTAIADESEFVINGIKTYDGIYLEVKAKPSDNYRKLGIVLDNTIQIGDNNFLSVDFRNLSSYNVPLSICLGNEQGARKYTGYSGSSQDYLTHYYIPENTDDIQLVKEYNGCIYLTSDIKGGKLLINLAEMTKSGNELLSFNKIFIGLPAKYNVGEKIELIDVSLIKSIDFSYDSENGFLPDKTQIVNGLSKTEVYDFTNIKSQSQLENLFGSYKLLKCNNENAVTSTFDKYVEIGKTEFAKGVKLVEKCIDGVKFSLDPNGNYFSSDSSQSNYANDRFGYIQIANVSSSPINVSDALAIKMCALVNNNAFRLIVVEQDGEVWRVGGKTENYTMTTANKEIKYVKSYYNCVWLQKGEGTLSVPYSSMTLIDDNSLAIPCQVKDKTLTTISKVYLSMDMAQSQTAIDRKIVIASLADVNFNKNKTKTIADLTSYTVSETSAKSGDVNYFSAEKSLITTPCSNNETANSNWILGKATIIELASKNSISKTHIGDIKVLDNFSIYDENYSELEKEEVVYGFYSTYGENSYLSIAELDDATALSWRIGNYQNEYQNASGGYCGLTLTTCDDADNWEDWYGAKGVTIRVKNPQSREVSFNFAFQQRENGETISYRMNYSNAAVYALDIANGEEFSFRTGAVSSFSSGPAIYLPANFDGWIRIAFSSFGKYSTSGPEEINLENDIIALKISSYMFDNSNMKIIFGCVGVYYDDFTIDWAFDNNRTTITDCMQKEI